MPSKYLVLLLLSSVLNSSQAQDTGSYQFAVDFGLSESHAVYKNPGNNNKIVDKGFLNMSPGIFIHLGIRVKPEVILKTGIDFRGRSYQLNVANPQAGNLAAEYYTNSVFSVPLSISFLCKKSAQHEISFNLGSGLSRLVQDKILIYNDTIPPTPATLRERQVKSKAGTTVLVSGELAFAYRLLSTGQQLAKQELFALVRAGFVAHPFNRVAIPYSSANQVVLGFGLQWRIF